MEDGDLRLKAPLSISMQAGVFIGRERHKQNREIGGRLLDMLAMSLAAPIWAFNVNILELVGTSQIPAGGRSVSPEVVVKAVSGTGRNWSCWHSPYADKETVSA